MEVRGVQQKQTKRMAGHVEIGERDGSGNDGVGGELNIVSAVHIAKRVTKHDESAGVGVRDEMTGEALRNDTRGPRAPGADVEHAAGGAVLRHRVEGRVDDEFAFDHARVSDEAAPVLRRHAADLPAPPREKVSGSGSVGPQVAIARRTSIPPNSGCLFRRISMRFLRCCML